MSQTVLIEKFIKFLKIQNTEESIRLAKELETNPRITGLCFGLALCRGGMRITGKLEWWEDVLAKISAWDEHYQSLKTQQVLRGAEPATNTKDHKENPTSISLEAIFNRAINYILLNHSSKILIPYLSPPRQIDAFRKDGYFELSDGKQTLIPNKTYTAAGHSVLFENDLNKPATKKAIENNICLLTSSNLEPHACELSYNSKTKEWSLYDPNYEDDKAKIFKDIPEGIRALLKEIKNILGADVTLEYCELGVKPVLEKSGRKIPPLSSEFKLPSLDKKSDSPKVNIPPSFKNYKRFLITNPQYVVEGWGTYALAKYAPEHLAMICPEKVKTAVTYINLPDTGGYTPLLLVAASDNAQAMEVLIKLGADVNLITESFSKTFNLAPLITAINYKNLNSLKTLLAYGADPNIFINGETPLSLAIKRDFQPAIRLLIERNADLNLVLLHAFNERNASTVEKCLELGADPNLVLLYAVQEENTFLMKKCLKFNADPHVGMLAAKCMLRYHIDTSFPKVLNDVINKEKLPLSEILKSKSPLVKALGAAYAYLGKRSILKIQSRKTTELFIKNLLKLNKSDLPTIQQEALHFLKGEGAYRVWYGSGSSSNSRDSRLSFLYDSGLFDGLIQGKTLSSAPFSQKKAEERRLISQILFQSKPALTDKKDTAKNNSKEEKERSIFGREPSKASLSNIEYVSEFDFLDNSNQLPKTHHLIFSEEDVPEIKNPEKKEVKRNSLGQTKLPETRDDLILLPSREKRSCSLSALTSRNGPALFQRRYSEPSINIASIPRLEQDSSGLEPLDNKLVLNSS